MELLSSVPSAEAMIKLNELVKKSEEKLPLDELTSHWLHDFANFVISCPDNVDDYLLVIKMIKLISRDKSCIGHLVSEPLMQQIIHIAQLADDHKDYNAINAISLEHLEAQRCLCNINFQNEDARNATVKLGAFPNLVERVKCFESICQIDSECLDLDIKLLFVMTGLCPALKSEAYKLGLIDTIIDLLNSIIDSNQVPNFKRASEILKLCYNVMSAVEPNQDSSDHFVSLATILHKFFVLDNGEKREGLINNCINLITTFPHHSVQHIMSLSISHDKEHLKCVDAALQCFETIYAASTPTEVNCLNPVLIVLIKMSSNRIGRKYLKMKILPPLSNEIRDRPESGNTLRNKLVRLMTDVSDVSVLAAELLFHICKRNVDRLIKYTGYGNAAGLLFRYGLMAGGVHEGDDMSTDEDSDTEVYNELRHSVDPVVGSVVPPRASPFEGMSEEQKEYEAMKLVEKMHEMMQKGVIKPANVGPDGKLVPMEHILQMQNEIKHDQQNEQSDSD